jgi:polyisoprenoid-binding protein YceI
MGNWRLDLYHTQVEFAETPREDDGARALRSHNETWDNDLRSSNFLKLEKFPTMTFRSTSVQPARSTGRNSV